MIPAVFEFKTQITLYNFSAFVDGYGFKFKSDVQAVCIVEKQNGNVKQVLVVLGQS